MTNILPINSATGQSHPGADRTPEALQTLREARSATNDPKKIDKAARNFESLLVGHWLEQAEKSFASVPGSDPDEQNDSSRDQFMSIACDSLAHGLSRGNGFGLARMISKQLQARSADANASTSGGEKEVGAKSLNSR